MDPITLAASVVALLAPYLTRVGEQLTDKAVDATVNTAEMLYQKVKEKFSKDEYARQTLERLEQEPESTSRQAATTAVLEEQVKSDPVFAEALQKTIAEEAKEAGPSIRQSVNVSGSNNRTRDINQFGTVTGEVDLSKREQRKR
jgi:hypothetical protein